MIEWTWTKLTTKNDLHFVQYGIECEVCPGNRGTYSGNGPVEKKCEEPREENGIVERLGRFG